MAAEAHCEKCSSTSRGAEHCEKCSSTSRGAEHCENIAYLTSAQEPAITPFLGFWRARRADAERFFGACLAKAGATPGQAKAQAEMMAEADQRGQYAYGSGLLDAAVCGLAAGAISASEPEVLSEKGGTALVDGHHGLGAYVADFCMALAIEKAKKAGIACVACRGSNHFGIAGRYVLRAAREGLIGMAMSNALPSVCPTRSAVPALGSNPIACAAQAKSGSGVSSHFALDMSTAAAARGKLQRTARRNEVLPQGWGLDRSGHETDDPIEVLAEGGLEPLGGDEEHAGYKGYCLGLMAEVLCSCLAGGRLPHEMQLWRDHPPQEAAEISHCFIVLNPASYNPNFAGSLQELLDRMRGLPRAGANSVRVAGDPEREMAQQQEIYVLYETWLIEVFRKLSLQLGVTLPDLSK